MTSRSCKTFISSSLALVTGALALVTSLQPQSASAQAQMACAPHKAVVAKLGETFKEHAASLGLAANGHMMQIYSTPSGETWTLVSTSPAGMSCILASGKHWQSIKPHADDPAA